ncbi:MAG: CBS domain-containing protein, partial [Planctomycetota bacterium]|nr:CBS domain-containing protein [Planctomycetota bacterium]
MAERDANIPEDGGTTEGAAGAGDATVIKDLRDSEDESEDRIAALIEASAGPEAIAREMQSQEPADAADILETLAPDASLQVLNQMDLDSAAEALSHMELPLAVSVLEDLEAKDAGALLARMEPDDAADILQELNKEDANELLRAMPRRKAAKLGQLALFDPQTAGGIMNTDYLWVDAEGTVADAIETVRRYPEKFDQPEILCLDSSKRLLGVVGMRELLVSPATTRLSEIMDREVDAVGPEVDSEEVAMAFDRYDYLSLPVVDQNSRVLGVVTIDDVVDIIRQEHTEDVYKQVGAGARESVYDRLPRKIRGRAPWLFINLGTSLVAAMVVALFQGVIESITL